MNSRPADGESHEYAAECLPAKRVCTLDSRAQLAEDNSSSAGRGETIEGSSIEVVNLLLPSAFSCHTELIGRLVPYVRTGEITRSQPKHADRLHKRITSLKDSAVQ